ncbi:YhdP family protein [Haliea salexigens]|uniref:YhdP family phospholipid transporter n=1 Tax=Haliea salexigens TaxID=287487 RepID=UPI0004810481|nr:AsmA-like C-terminal region-containing protein [Haliea salexigens]
MTEPLSIYHRISRLLWRGMVATVVALAVYVSAGRVLVGMVAANQQWLIQNLSAHVPFHIERGALAAEWHGFGPELVFRDLQLVFADGEPLTLGGGRVAIDVWGSLLQGSLRIGHLRLSELLLSGEITASGEFRLMGLGGSGGDAAARLRALLLDSRHVTLENNTLYLQSPAAQQEVLSLNLALQRDGSRRQLRATLDAVDGSHIRVLADGIGDPLSPARYDGVVYINAALADLATLDRWRPLWGQPLPLGASGKALVEGWLDWNGEMSDLRWRLSGEDLILRGATGGWSLPVDRLSLEAGLQQQGQRLGVFVSDLQITHAGSQLAVPRLQIDVWGDSLRVRGRALPLTETAGLVQAAGVLPEGLATVLSDLQPGGELRELQFTLDDMTTDLPAWALSLGFADVSLASWRGAPGVTGASGHLQLAPSRGHLTLDSENIALDFPTVFSEALAYRELFGSLDIAWSETGVALDSGLLTAVGEEGEAHALLGLWIPLAATQTGIEMDLLVGLRDSDARYRQRYLPHILDDKLLTWLESSVQRATLDAGGFIWRGSLRPGLSTRRTVQLFFALRDAELAYHPRWPALSVPEGTVLIDDAQVSVWADQARLYSSAVSGVSAETWRTPAGRLRLAIAASGKGSAADGLRVINESPLDDTMQGALQQWSATGDLQLDLSLDLPLEDAGLPTQVALEVALADGELAIRPGGLDIDGLAGQLRYTSAEGFVAEGVTARLWGRELDVTLTQHAHGAEGEASGVSVALAGDIAMASLRDWLGGALPQWVAGEAPVTATLEFVPGARPQLRARSSLLGVALALPETWGKPPDEALPFTLDSSLGSGPLLLELRAADRAWARAVLREGELDAVSLGLQDQPLPPVSGTLRLSGHAALLDIDAWHAVLAPLMPPTSAPATATAAAPLQLDVEQLLVDSLLFAGQDWRDTLIDVQQTSAGWRGTLEAPWLRTAVSADTGLSSLVLNVDWLDVAGLGGSGGDAPDPGAISDWPDIDVAIAELLRGGRPLGQLSFALRPGERRLQVQQLQGRLADLQIAADPAPELSWSDQGTRLRMGLVAGDLAATLTALGYEAIVETEQGRFDVDMQWPGAPQQFSLADASGGLTLALENGRFLSASAGTSGALRVVSILDLADIVQRLSLTQWFESGIPFDRMSGELRVQDGVIRVPQIAVTGAGSSFRFSGRSNVASRELDGELVATLPVANNLPWVAALTAGLPVAAGVFVVSKLFEKQVSQLSSAVYRISGTWQEPAVRLDRIFDTRDGAEKELVVPAPEPAADGQSTQDASSSPASAAAPSPAADESSRR